MTDAAGDSVCVQTQMNGCATRPEGQEKERSVESESRIKAKKDTQDGNDDNAGQEAQDLTTKRPWAFWVIMLVMCMVAFTASLDGTIIVTALPRITDEIGGHRQYVWIANSFLLPLTVLQPLFGQLSNVYGRRDPFLFSLVLFVIGAGIAGGAHNVGMLIGGRAVQGSGGAGIYVIGDIIIADLVSLRDRAKYFSLVLSAAAVGNICGPLLGGALAEVNWRWCFYINLPLGGISLLFSALYLKMKHTKEPNWRRALGRVDLVGNAVFIPSMTAILFGLIAGGEMYSWSSFRVILPIVIGVIGWVVFHIYEGSRWCKEPSVPSHLFSNRTSAAGFVLAFISAVMLDWICYWLPFYFQAVWGTSPLLSGVFLIPLLAFIIPSGAVAGIVLSKTGQYKTIHWAGFALISVGVGTFSILRAGSSPAEWVFFQIIASIGLGFANTAILPAINAGLEEKDVASATSVYSFLRALGYVWGVTISSVIFNNQASAHADMISDEDTRRLLSGGGAYGYGVSGSVNTLPSDVKAQVLDIFSEALKIMWYAALAFNLLGFLLVAAEKNIELRSELETEFGLESDKKDNAAVENA